MNNKIRHVVLLIFAGLGVFLGVLVFFVGKNILTGQYQDKTESYIAGNVTYHVLTALVAAIATGIIVSRKKKTDQNSEK